MSFLATILEKVRGKAASRGPVAEVREMEKEATSLKAEIEAMRKDLAAVEAKRTEKRPISENEMASAQLLPAQINAAEHAHRLLLAKIDEIWAGLPLSAATTRAEILRMVDSAFSPRRAGNELGVPQVNYRSETILAIGKRAGKPFATPEQLDALKKLEAQWLKGYEQLTKWTPAAAADKWRNEQVALAEKLIKGEPIDDDDGWSRDDWERDFRSKTESGRMVMTAAGKAANQILQAVAANAMTLIEQVEKDLLVEEFERFREFAIPMEVTAFSRHLWGITNQVRRAVKQWNISGDCGRPSDAAAMLGITL